MGWCELPCKTHGGPWLSHPSDHHLVPHRAQRLCEWRLDRVWCPAAHERAHSAQVSPWSSDLPGPVSLQKTSHTFSYYYLCIYAAGCVSQCPAHFPLYLPPMSCCCPSEWLTATRVSEDTLKPLLRKVSHDDSSFTYQQLPACFGPCPRKVK